MIALICILIFLLLFSNVTINGVQSILSLSYNNFLKTCSLIKKIKKQGTRWIWIHSKLLNILNKITICSFGATILAAPFSNHGGGWLITEQCLLDYVLGYTFTMKKYASLLFGLLESVVTRTKIYNGIFFFVITSRKITTPQTNRYDEIKWGDEVHDIRSSYTKNNYYYTRF